VKGGKSGSLGYRRERKRGEPCKNEKELKVTKLAKFHVAIHRAFWGEGRQWGFGVIPKGKWED